MPDIEQLNYGEAPNDKKGFDARTSEMITDNNFKAIVEWITGGAKQFGRISNVALPVSRGGTEASTAMQARINLGLVTGPNNEIVFGNNAVELFNSKYTKYGKVNNDYAFTKVGVGDYKLEGLFSDSYGTGYKMVLPKDDLGNVLVGATIAVVSGVASIKTFAITVVEGKATLSAVPMDIPDGRFILFNIK